MVRIMNKVEMKEFYERQADFLHRHDCRMEQSGDVSCYYKNWMSEDGSFMTEINRIVTEEVEVEVRGIRCKVQVRLFETECYSSEWGSMYLYQQA